MGSPVYVQRGRLLEFSCPLPSNTLLAVGLEGREELSRPFLFTLELRSPLTRRVVPHEVLRKDCAVAVQQPGQPPRFFNGLLSEFRHLGHDHRFHHYRATLVPAVAMLARTVRSRIFQSQSVPGLVRKILHEHGIANEWKLGASYPIHNILTQYEESDLAFVQRHLEEEGIHYYFRHSREQNVLVLSDDSTQAPLLPGGSTLEWAIGSERNTAQKSTAAVTSWRKRQMVQTGRCTARDYHFQVPKNKLEASHAASGKVECGTVKHELSVNVGEWYEHHGQFGHRFDAVGLSGGAQPDNLQHAFDDNKRVAELMAEEQTCRSLRIEGESPLARLTSGFGFHLAGGGGARGDYTVVRVDHVARVASFEGDQAGGGKSDEEELHYENRFTALPRSLKYRPPRLTQAPKATPQTALVVGVSEDEIFTDLHGRIKVRFYWDREGKKDASSSCWVRLGSSLAGAGYGMVTLPRQGQEVLIGFLHDDPDQPVALGTVYNPEQMPPFPLPENKTQSGLKSHTKGGSRSQYSGIGFEDKDGSEHMQLHSQRHLNYSTKRNLYINSGNNHYESHAGGLNQITGGLPFANMSVNSGIDGGSGSGSGDSNEAPGEWTTGVFGEFGEAMDLVLGLKEEALAGFYSEGTIGWHMATTMNPIGMLAALNLPGELVAKVPSPLGTGGLMTASQGNCGAVIATSNAIVYGPAYKISRGPIIDHTYATFTGTPNAVIINALAILYAAITCGEILIRLISPGTVSNVMALVMAALQELSFSLWISQEARGFYMITYMNSPKQLEDMVKALTKSGTAAALTGCETSFMVLEQYIMMQARQIQDATLGEIALSGLGEGVWSQPMEGTVAYRVSDGILKLQAPGIHLYSNPPIDTETAGITLAAYGKESLLGKVLLYGSGFVHVQCGAAAAIDLAAVGPVGQVKLNHGPGGTTVIQAGELPMPQVMVSGKTGMVTMMHELEFSATVGLSAINITPAGVTIGTPAANIFLSVGSISVTGPVITKTGDAVLDSDFPMANETVAEKSVNAGLVSNE